MATSAEPQRPDVLIAGAGPVGLALACHLRLAGVSVRILEKRSAPSEHSKAIGLQYRVSEVLARLGIVDRFLARGGSPTSVNIYHGTERLVRLQFTAPPGISGRDAFEPRAILLPQSETEQILIDYLQELGTRIEWNTTLLGFTQDEERVIATTDCAAGAATIECGWLVGCEGAHSAVRKQTGISFEGKTYPLAFLMADVRLAGGPPHEENHVWMHEDGSLAALPLPADRTWRLFIEITRAKDITADDVSIGRLEHLMSERAPGLDANIDGEPLWLSEFRINCRMVDRMRDRRVFLAGDAAHIHSPTGGQGITTGMQDAANLGWKLARVVHGAPETLLDTYQEERLPHAAEVLRETDRTTRVMFAPTPVLRFFRDRVMLPLLRSPRVQRRMFGKLSQLHVHYRNSSLSVDLRPAWRRRKLRAGDRAPDVAFINVRGSVVTLFELLRPMKPIVLVAEIPEAGSVVAEARALDVALYAVRERKDGALSEDFHLADAHGDFGSLYGLRRGFAAVIRPDGHIGFISSPADKAGLFRYLQRLGRTKPSTTSQPATPPPQPWQGRPPVSANNHHERSGRPPH